MQRALTTVAYVMAKMTYGAANRPADHPNLKSQLRAFGALDKVRTESDRAVEARFVNPADAYRYMQIWAEKVEKHGGGNCGEQSALAFIHLRRLGGCYPLTWVYFTNRDHAFVMIGWPAADGWDASKGWPPKTPAPWFQDAVICDPWDNRAAYWSDMALQYNRANLGRNYHLEAESQMTVWINK